VRLADELKTILSPHAKLATYPSTNNYAMHFNMLNRNLTIGDIGKCQKQWVS
jgi:hypothetical protein